LTEPLIRFFDALYVAVSEKLAGKQDVQISRYGTRGLFFSVQRSQPRREAAVNFQGGQSFLNMGTAAIPVEVVNETVAIRLSDAATLTVEQWADSICHFILQPAASADAEKKKSAAAPAPKASAAKASAKAAKDEKQKPKKK
jgi:hypothetical protein